MIDDSAVAVIDHRRQVKEPRILATFLFEVVRVDGRRLKAQSFNRHWETEMCHNVSLINGCGWLVLLPKKVLTITLRCRLELGSIQAVIVHELAEIEVGVELFDVFELCVGGGLSCEHRLEQLVLLRGHY